MKRTRIALLTGLVVVAVLASACGSAAPPVAPQSGASGEGAPYLIGAFFSTTGTTSSLGQPEADTVTMLAEQVNAAGGITGPDGKKHKVEVHMYDDASDSTKAVEVVKKLIDQDKVPVIIGGSGSPASIAVAQTVTDAKVPFISVASSSAIVTPIEKHYWVFKTPQQNLPVAQVQYDWLKAHGFTKVASLGVNNAFGADSMAALQQVAKENGLTIVYEGKFEPGSTDFSSQLTQIAGSGAEAVIVHATPGEGAPLTVQYRSLGLKMPLLHNHGIGNQAFIDTAKDAANGVLFPIGKLLVADQLPDSDVQKKVLIQYQSDYKAKYGGKSPSTFGGHAWDAFMMVKAALESVGPDSAKIRDYLETKITNFVGISGVFNMSAQDHTGIGKESLVLVEITGGKWIYIAPDKYASVP